MHNIQHGRFNPTWISLLLTRGSSEQLMAPKDTLSEWTPQNRLQSWRREFQFLDILHKLQDHITVSVEFRFLSSG